MTTTVCFIGLGSNLEDPARQIERALDALAQLRDSQLLAASPRYGSRAIGPGQQPDFVNAVASLSTRLAPLDLLDALQTIENQHERRREVRWGPRTLDLDLLLYGDMEHQCERLTLPHPRLRERVFVIKPLHDIAPALTLPDGTSLAALLDYIDNNDLWPLATQRETRT